MWSGSGRSRRTVRLFCPAVSKAIQLVVAVGLEEQQKLDLGSIARTFGLDPATLRLNGHFISRGVDFVSSSVTWKSLLSFFAARGLSTGTDDRDAVIVDGKLYKPGTKRVHNHSDSDNGDYHQNTEYGIVGIKRKQQLEDVNMLKKTKIGGESNSDKLPAGKIKTHEGTSCDDIGLKRKSSLEDVNPLKRMRMKSGSSGSQEEPSNTINSGVHLACGYTNRNLKRVREDELIMATPCKRTR